MMIESLPQEQCTGCMSCLNKCPVDAIFVVEDEEGFAKPKINWVKCIQCNQCEKACPLMCDKHRRYEEFQTAAYAAWSNNKHIRYDSTSGGIFTELANYIIASGGMVSGAIYDKDWSVKHILTDKISDISKMRSSKYVQSRIDGNLYKRIEHCVKMGRFILFCGTPCQASGLRQYLGKEYKNLYICDFICRGINSPKVFRKYLEYLELKYNSRIKSVKFKDKSYGWHWFATKILFVNHSFYLKDRYTDSYMRGYLEYNYFMRKCCYNCKFKEHKDIADITLGDFWGIENYRPDLDNDLGTSAVLIHSIKGSAILEGIKENIHCRRVNIKMIEQHNKCLFDSPDKNTMRDDFFKNIDRMPFDKFIKIYIPHHSIFHNLYLTWQRLKRRMRLI